MSISTMRPHADVLLAAGNRVEEPDPDRVPLNAALERAEIRAAWPAWNDPTVDWSHARVVFPRATWDYHRDLAGFLRWVDAVSEVTTLRNPAPVIHWNIDKRYMLELMNAGLPCVPTRVVEQGASTTLAQIQSDEGWARMVIKPAVSCGSWQTHALDEAGDVDGHWARLVRERVMLAQPFVESVETTGERSAVVIDGELTHVMRKNPRFAGGVESVSGPFEPTDAERRLVERSLRLVEADLDYARVDMVADADGSPMIAELELVEPSLFFGYSERALARFIGLLERYIQQP